MHRLFRSRQRLEIDRYGFAIGRAQLLRVRNDLDHGATDSIGIRCHSRLKRLNEVLNLPVVKFALRDVGDAPLASRALSPREAPARDNGA